MTIISKKARYTIHGLAYIAAFSDDKPIPFGEILAYLRAYSRTLTLSSSYIAKIFQEVARTGLVSAVPGPHGGYQLSRSAERITLVEIIEAMDGPLIHPCCLLSVGGCTNQSSCGVNAVVREGEQALFEVFRRETLNSLAVKMQFPDESTIEAHRIVAGGRK